MTSPSRHGASPMKLSAILLLAGSVLFALCGGGTGAYFAITKTRSTSVAGTTPPPAEPKPPLGVEPAKTATSPEPSGPQDHTNAKDKYIVRFPAPPEVRSERAASPGRIGQVVTTGCDSDGLTYSAFMRMNPEKIRSGDQALDGAVVEVRKLYKDWMVLEVSNVTHAGHSGKRMVFRKEGSGSVVLRLVSTKRRYFCLSVAGEDVTADSPRVTEFFASLRILPHEADE